MEDLAKAIIIQGRTFEVGHPIKVLPSAPRKRDGFETTIRGIRVKDGEVTGIDVASPRGVRTFPLSRIKFHIRNISKKQEAANGKP